MTNLSLPLPDAPALPSTARLHHGDCLDIMSRMQKDTVDMCFADLPFAITACSWDVLVDLAEFVTLTDAVGKDAMIRIMCGTQPFASVLINHSLKSFRYEIIWQKGRPTGFQLARLRPLRDHESVLIFSKKVGTYNPQMTKGGRTYKDMNIGKKGNIIHHAMVPMKRTNHDGTLFPRTIQFFPSINNRTRLHPTQKPVALLEWLIATYTNPGDTVLDPVFGSCTTGVACARLGRNFIGIEKDETYFNVGRDRLNAERERLGLPHAEA